MTLAELHAKRAALLAARLSGALRTTFRSGGTERTVEYKSDSEMAAALDACDAEILRLEGKRSSTIRLTFSKGY